MTQISLRVEDDVKKRAEEVCADIGMSLSTAINIYLKKLGREKRIPFEVAVDPFYSEKNMDRLMKSVAQKDIERNGYESIGKPERLSGNLSAYYKSELEYSGGIQ